MFTEYQKTLMEELRRLGPTTSILNMRQSKVDRVHKLLRLLEFSYGLK